MDRTDKKLLTKQIVKFRAACTLKTLLGGFYAFYFRGKSEQEIKNKGLLNDTTGLQTSTQSQPSLLRICKANLLPNFLCRPASGSTMRSSANVEKQLLNDIASYFLLQIRSSESTSQPRRSFMSTDTTFPVF